MNHLLVTTAFDLPGYRVLKSLGLVRGIVVRSRSVIGNFGAAIQLFSAGTSRSTPDSASALDPMPMNS